MASLIQSHLEQISLCAISIEELRFQGPKPFTNALLDTSHDITSLIRDTEHHERALFHLAPPSLPRTSHTRSKSILGVSTGERGQGTLDRAARRATASAGRREPKNRAIAAVLGGDLFAKTRRVESTKGQLDVEVLLQGAEKLAAL